MSVVCQRGCGAVGHTAPEAAQQPAQERGFFAAVTHGRRVEALPCTQDTYPACRDSNAATQAAGSHLAKQLSSPYPTAAQRDQSPSGPTCFGKTEPEPGRSQPHPSETLERDAATGAITSSANECWC